MSDDAKGVTAVPTKLNTMERAAVLLMTVGEQDAAQVLKHLGPREVQRLGTTMAQLSNVQRGSVETVFNDFIGVVREQTGLGVGNEEYIRTMLVSALGEDRAGSLIDRILLGGSTKGLDTLKWLDSRSVAELIRYEHPQIQAIVISYLDPDQAADVLQSMPENVRLDLVVRIAKLTSVQPTAIQELNDILEKQFSATNAPQKGLGGVKCAADIMNFLDTAVESKIMEALQTVDEALASSIADLMFVFDNLKEVDDRGIQSLLREVSSEVLILALKGSDEELREKIFRNMSKRAAELLRDDLENKGPVKVSDVQTAQKEILAVARRLAEAGELVLGGKGGEQML
ncbi:MAG: flagellar motor switch protein FliG [Pseudomonadales bacterium]|nr:flagellar motor switch protein FliG [Pseudomonadales bacterium]